MITKFLKSVLPKPTKMALIVRGDLKISKGKTASQCSHAAVLCYQTAVSTNDKLANSWMLSGQPKIVLKVDSLTELETLYKKARDMDVIVSLVRDAGKTQIEPGTQTAIGLLDYTENVDSLTSHLKLL